MRHFHGTYKSVCDKHDPTYYARFKKWADEYFWCKHREQTRGLGGIFFDDLNDRPKEEIVKFSAECLASVVPAYVPIVHKHKNDEFSTKQKEWQAMRRVREFFFNDLFFSFDLFFFFFPSVEVRKQETRSFVLSPLSIRPVLLLLLPFLPPSLDLKNKNTINRASTPSTTSCTTGAPPSASRRPGASSRS